MRHLLDMVPKILISCLVFAVCSSGILGQVATLCRPNERLLPCGCPKTCRDPAPDCKGVCQMGCFCEEGEVRNDTGHCVKLADCPPIATAYRLDTTEPRANGGICPHNEEYRFCEPCNKTCANPNPICRAQCARGCFCKDGLLRDLDGSCVKLEECSTIAEQPNEDVNFIIPLPYMSCGKNQIYKSCETCERTCNKPTLTCQPTCMRGCFCLKGYVKAPNGSCVRLEDCPKAEVTFGGAQEPSIEDCSSDEEYFSCGWCEPSCSAPAPSCPVGVCIRGCLCRPPLLRHRSGVCVQEKDCTPQKCMNPNEEYVCRYGCEPSCGARVCFGRSRLRRCELGCHCKLGHLRDVRTGLCVLPAACDANKNDTRLLN